MTLEVVLSGKKIKNNKKRNAGRGGRGADLKRKIEFRIGITAGGSVLPEFCLFSPGLGGNFLTWFCFKKREGVMTCFEDFSLNTRFNVY